MQFSRDLFDLVHSMSRQERRYFKMYTTFYSSKTANTYTRLFDAIAAVPLYDEEGLRRKVRKESFAGHLSAAKNKLGKLLLQSLAAYTGGRTVTQELYETLVHVKLLYDRGLYDYCARLLARARKKAEQFEKHNVLLEIHQWERRLLIERSPESFDKDLLNYYRTVELWVENLALTLQYLELLDRMQAACRRYQSVRRTEDRAVLDRLAAHPLLEMHRKAPTFRALVARLTTLGDYAWISGKPVQALQFYAFLAAEWESRPERIRENINAYRGCLCNYATMMIAAGRDAHFPATMEKIRRLPFRSGDSRVLLFDTLYYLELLYALNHALPERALTIAQKIEGGIARYAAEISSQRLVALYHNCALAYLVNERFAETLRVIHIILNLPWKSPKQDTQIHCRLLQLVCLYELAYIDTLESALRGVQRYFGKLKGNFPFERCVLRHMQRLLTKAGVPAVRASFGKLRRELLALLHEEVEQAPPGLMEIMLWVESSLTGTSLSAVYREIVRRRDSGSGMELFQD